MNFRRLAACGVLAVTGGALAAWLATGSDDSAERVLPAPPFLRGPVAARTLDGEKIDFRAPASGVAVVAFYSHECPDALEALPAVSRLAAETPARRMFLVAVSVDRKASEEEVGRRARALGLGVPIVHDRDGALAREFGVKAVPEAFVLDEDARLLYRGRVVGRAAGQGGDDLGPDLRAAVASALDGRPIAGPHPEASGCPSPESDALATRGGSTPTFHRDVAPILRRSCQPCHRPGQSGPFPLVTPVQAAKRARDLADVTARGLMPPWKPAPGVGPPLRHDRTLLASEIATLRAWADAGAPEGPRIEPSEPVASPTDDDGWVLGPPDLVLEMDRPFEVPATGDDLYRCFVMPTDLPEDRFLTAIEVRPGNPRVVHHTFGYVDNRGLGRSRDAEDPLPGYSCFSGFTGDRIFGLLGGWTPGNEPRPFGDGVGLELPRRVDVVMQVHYHPSGKPESDRTRLGLYFSKGRVRQALEWVSACPNPGTFHLPAGEADFRIAAELEVPIAVELHAMTPHMHLLGKRFRAGVRLPGGRHLPLIEIADWDFNRQDTYYLREPLALPAGSVLEVEGWFDNTSANARNPNRPPQVVRWGEATTDDMLILFLALTQSGQDLTRPGARNDFMETFFRPADPPPGSSEAQGTSERGDGPGPALK